MALIRSLALALIFAFALARVCADAGIQDHGINIEEVVSKQEEADHHNLKLQKQVAELESRLSILDSNLKQAKQESFDKSRKIVGLETEIATLQKRASGDLEKKLETSEAKAEDSAKQVLRLEEAVKKLESKLQTSQKKLDASEAKVHELTEKNEQAEKTIQDLRKQLRDAEEALKLTESLMRKAEAEAAAKAQELYKAYEAWLPPWAASRLAQVQTTSAAYWAVHGEPFLKKATEQASQHAATAKEWATPHMEALKTKVGPAAKVYWETLSNNGKAMSSKVSESFNIYVLPHVEKARPYVQDMKEKLRPHVDKAGVVIRPYYEKGRAFATPHFDKLHQASQHAFIHVVNYHHSVQNSIREQLLKHEKSAVWATSAELLWFLATALLVVPCVGMLVICLQAFSGKKVQKPTRSQSTGNHKKHRRPSNKQPIEKSVHS